MASAQRQQGLCNFIADRMDMHQRWQWQLSATLKPEPMEAPAPATPTPMGNAAVGE
jgi:hypothetical protein